MKKNPSSVTRFGASHNGNNSTKPFHCCLLERARGNSAARRQGEAYIVFEDVAGDGGFVNARVFVRFQMLQRIFGDALMCRRDWCLSAGKLAYRKRVYSRALGILGCVTGRGSDMETKASARARN
jgi:hypothetical protein